jgi:HlyD family secretion protein
MLEPSTRPHKRHAARRAAARWVKRGVLAAGALAGIAGLVYAWLPKPIAVDVGVVRRTALAVEVAEDGRTRVRDRFVVTAPIAGNLARVELQAGDALRAGDPIARIAAPDQAMLDPRSRDEAAARLRGALARQRQADSAIVRARAARDSAVHDADRARQLAARDVITAVEREHAELAERLAIEDLGTAELAREVANADVAAARAVVAGGKPTEGALVVRAPAAGQVLKLVRDSAGPIAAGAPIVELGDPRAIEAVVDVLSSDGAQIAPGMPVALEAWGGDHPLAGHVRVVEPSAFTKLSALGVEEQRVNVIVALDGDAPPALGDGFRVEARIVTWSARDVLAVPASAVFRDRGKWAVYVVEAGRARLRDVELGHRGRVDIEVVGGLPEGAQVILHPSDRVREGVSVAGRQ